MRYPTQRKNNVQLNAISYSGISPINAYVNVISLLNRDNGKVDFSFFHKVSICSTQTKETYSEIGEVDTFFRKEIKAKQKKKIIFINRCS